MKILLPLVLLLLGTGGGVGAGLALRPGPAPPPADIADGTDADTGLPAGDADAAPLVPAAESAEDPATDERPAAVSTDYIKLNNQFVVPIVAREKIEAVIVMSLSLEVPSGQSEAVYRHEPKLRDAFLQVMFDHANMGGFAGVFTDTARLDALRAGLLDVASQILDDEIESILITDFVRQQM